MVDLTLTEFLLARITEDEWAWRAINDDDEWLGGRLLAECKVKRRTMEEHPPTDPINHDGDRYCRRCLASGYDTGYPDEWVQAFYPCPTLRLLASVYADHPDYHQEWKP